MVNEGRMLSVLGVINLNPERHEQRYWACGTARCFGGWAIELFSDLELEVSHNGFYVPVDAQVDGEYINGHPLDTWVMRDGGGAYLYANTPGGCEPLPGEREYVSLDSHRLAQDLLGLSDDDAASLFNAHNTLEEVNHIALGIITGTEYMCGHDCTCSKCEGACDCEECYDLAAEDY